MIAPHLAAIGRILNLQSFGTYANSPLFSNLQPRQKRNKVINVSKVFDLICSYAAPNDEQSLKTAIEKAKFVSIDESNEFVSKVMEQIYEAYCDAAASRGRYIALSLVTDHFNYETVASYIPGLNQYEYYCAKQFNIFKDVVIAAPGVREKNRNKVEYFIRFICRPEIMVDLPRGHYVAKLSNNQKIEIGAMLKQHTNANIIRLYEKFLADTNNVSMKMATSSYYDILNCIPSKKTTASACVDYFFARGEEAFVYLQDIIEKLATSASSNQERLQNLSIELKKSRMFLVSEYRQSLSMVSSVFDFNASYALSDPENQEFRDSLLTKPIHRSEKALKLESQIAEVHDFLNANINNAAIFSAHEKELFLNKMKLALKHIPELKAHYLRSFFTAQTKSLILSELKPKEALLTMDFAQKFLPKYYLEAQNVS